MKKTVINNSNFAAWSAFFGCLVPYDGDERMPSSLWAFENKTDCNKGKTLAVIPSLGACYGYVQSGEITLVVGEFVTTVRAGGYFSTPAGARFSLAQDTVVVVSQRFGFTALSVVGHAIEARGRLRYIDQCSDTLLLAPPLRGDPCFNHLHFPPHIDQTEHTHPSTRFGIVAYGRGGCITPGAACDLYPGLVFWIPKDGLHKFFTTAEDSMGVIAYHPDSDFGPTHEHHPMVNRTLVDGEKIDNAQGRHLGASVIDGYFPSDPTHVYYEADDECPVAELPVNCVAKHPQPTAGI